MNTDNLKRIVLKNNYVKSDSETIVFPKKNTVNINAWIDNNRNCHNIGDYLSVIIINEIAKKNGIDINSNTDTTRHLYGIGSILLGYQDAVIWGSGFLEDQTKKKFFNLYSLLHKYYHKTDVRSVRGPLTKFVLDKIGIECPEIYGDPAVLTPLIYTPKIAEKKIPYLIVPHYNDDKKYHQQENVLNTFVSDYTKFINKLCSAELIISSSLHGIILAEAYGIPAIMLKNSTNDNIFKYRDYYLSTNRENFHIADSVEDALRINNVDLLDNGMLKKLQNNCLDSFPVDLWKSKT